MGYNSLALVMIVAFAASVYYYCSSYLSGDKADSVVVEIPNGKLRGYQYQRDKIFAFESIPYAEAPVGEARFEPPKQYTIKWNEIRDAKSPPPACMQWTEFPSDGKTHLEGEEDCLYLNVYTPNVNGNQLFPVIVFFHGGAFMHGSSRLCNPNLVSEGTLVYVTVNYRLGPLGFLSTEDEQIPGNMGLKDQHMAIKWVKENIKVFRGDPENIIISGFSAGGASVHYHVLSKKSEGLVKAAVSHSGSALCPWASIENPLMRTKKLASLIKCPTDTTHKIKECLKKRKGSEIVNAVGKFMVFLNNPFTVFGPVVEPTSSKDPFLVDNVEKLMKDGKTAKIPWLLTYTVDEGVYNAAYLLRRDVNGIEFIRYLDQKWEKVAPLMLFFNESVPVNEHAKFANQYKIKYLGDQTISRNTYVQVQKMLTDRLFLEGIQKSVELYRDYNEAPVYVYAFDHPAPFNLGQVISGRRDVFFGTGHGDDVYLIFNTKFVRGIQTFTEVEKVILKKLIQLYENFAKTGIPSYGDLLIPKNIPNSKNIKLLRVKGTEALIEYTTVLD